MPAASWQDAILSEFSPGVSPLTVVADPDGLLQDDEILATLQERGFSLLRFEDPIAFRYAYESRYRRRKAQADAQGLVVLVPAPPAALDNLPHDILTRSRRLAFSLADLFPSLNQAVVSALEPADRAALYQAASLQQPAALGENASKDFVLRHVFGVDPDLLRTPAALLSVLLRRHYAGQRVPPALDARFIEAIKERFQHWPLGRIVPDREAFFDFLQRRWRMFLDASAEGTGAVREGTDALASALPFDHEDVRVYIDNLFTEGLLHPISHWQAATLSKTWLGVGVQWDARQDAAARLDRLLAIAAESLPEQEARHQDWFRFVEQPNVRVAGLVVDKVDRIMHGMTLGAAGMHNQVRQWASQGHFAALLGLLFAHGFRVYVTADHGNVEAVGCGRPNEGAVADMRGERVRVYSDEGLRRSVADRFSEAWSWPAEGLPAGYLPLLAPGRKAFVREGERVVAHGGVCIEELIVPFVQVVPSI